MSTIYKSVMFLICAAFSLNVIADTSPETHLAKPGFKIGSKSFAPALRGGTNGEPTEVDFRLTAEDVGLLCNDPRGNPRITDVVGNAESYYLVLGGSTHRGSGSGGDVYFRDLNCQNLRPEAGVIRFQPK